MRKAYKSSVIHLYIIAIIVSYLTIVCDCDQTKNHAPAIGNKIWSFNRLPNFISPTQYDILLYTDISLNSFLGFVNISIDVKKDTEYVVLHAKELNITDVSVYDSERKENLTIEKTFAYPQYDYFVIEIKLLTGKYILQFRYYGDYGTDKGLYKISYRNGVNDERFMITTFFAPNYARKVFPCFDEPAFKSVFKVSVIHNSNYFALSNSLVEDVQNKLQGLTLTQFENTPSMSSYLLCIIVCDFKYYEILSESGVKIRAYAVDKNIEKTKLALNCTSRILTYFENLFEIPFPLKKLDIISLPYFSANGMENWGLITFDELHLLLDDSSTSADKLIVAKLVAHELAHMWFGNLVTMKWWNETWLNEGFATHFAWKGAKLVLPDYFLANDAGIRDLYSIMEIDKLNYTRPVIQPINEVFFNDVYDEVIYLKGASLLRMIEYNMGEKFFIKGISNYLKNHTYGSVTTKHVWDELNKFKQNFKDSYSWSGKDLAERMDSWMMQKGFPFASVTQSCEAVAYKFSMDLDYEHAHSRSMYSVWTLPLSFRTAESNDSYYISLQPPVRTAFSCGDSYWWKFNVNFEGYYLVEYTERNWLRLMKALENDHSKFSPADRINMLVNSFMLASGGNICYSIPLSITRYLKTEEYHESWNYALKQLTVIQKFRFKDRRTIRIIKKYIKYLSYQFYTKLGWKNEGDYQEKNLRQQIIHAACGNNLHICLRTAAESFKNWMEGQSPDTELLELILKYGLQKLNNEESFNYVWSRYLREENPLLKSKYKKSLSAVRKTKILERLLNYVTNETYFTIPSQIEMLHDLADNNRGMRLISRFIFSNWEDITDKYGIEEAEIIAEKVFSQYQSERELKEVKKFYKKYPSTNASLKLRMRTLKKIRLNIEWRQKYQDTVKDWFDKESLYLGRRNMSY